MTTRTQRIINMALAKENESALRSDKFKIGILGCQTQTSNPKPIAIVTPSNTPSKQENYVLKKTSVPLDFEAPSQDNGNVNIFNNNETLSSESPISNIYVDSGEEYQPTESEEEDWDLSNTNHNALPSTSSKKKKTNRSFNPSSSEAKPIADSSEEPLLRKVTINEVKKSDSGSIVRSKGHSCLFCHKVMINLHRHLEIVHHEEVEVAKLMSMPKSSATRRIGFIELSRVGDYYHNCEVLAKKTGELILVRRPSPGENFDYTKYGPCPYCLGFMLKQHLWHHTKYSCSVKMSGASDSRQFGRVLKESRILLSSSLNQDLPKAFLEHVVSSLRDDVIGNTAKNDPTIEKFGVLQFEKYGLTQVEMTRQNMRQLARLLLALQNQNLKTEGDKKQLNAWLHPANFDAIIAAVKNVCIQDDPNSLTLRPEFKIPSLAMKLGHHIKKCIGIDRGVALRSCNRHRNKELKDLLALLEGEWAIKISSNALATISSRHMNKTKLLPLTEDLVKLNDYIGSEINSLKSIIGDFNWIRFAELTLCKIVLFNKRRSGEASRLTVTNYTSRSNWTSVATQETNMSLTDLEKKLSGRLGLIETIGKRGKTVPVIITPDVKENIDILISKRNDAGVNERNEFIFSRLGGSLGHLRGHDCLNKMCNEAKLKSPHLITSTNLRKYIATVVQIFNLSENETDWLARHLGHDVRVHREFYRTQESVVETTKISRILLAVEQGKAHMFKGKKLDDINVDLLDYSDESEDSSNSDEEEINEPELSRTNEPELSPKNNKNQAGLSPKNHKNPAELNKKNNNIKHNQKAKGKKRPWSLTEREATLTFFRTLISKGIIPQKEQCEKCIESNSGSLKERSWRDIKYYVYNHIKMLKKRARIE